MRNGDMVTVKATGERVAVVTVNESHHKVKSVDVVDSKGKARRLRGSEVEA